MWCKFIKHSYIKKNNIQFPSNVTQCEDTATTASLFMDDPLVYCCPQFLYNIYYHADSTANSRSNRINDLEIVLTFISDELKKREIYKMYESELINFSKSIIQWGYFMVKGDMNQINKINEIYDQWLNKLGFKLVKNDN